MAAAESGYPLPAFIGRGEYLFLRRPFFYCSGLPSSEACCVPGEDCFGWSRKQEWRFDWSAKLQNLGLKLPRHVCYNKESITVQNTRQDGGLWNAADNPPSKRQSDYIYYKGAKV